MLWTAHLLAGAAVGVVLKEPALVASTSFALHYVLDGVPHYSMDVKDWKTKGLKGISPKEILIKGIEPIAGLALTIGIICLASPSLKVPIAIGAAFGLLPDILGFLEWKYEIRRPKIIKTIEDKYHKHVGGLKGFLPQAALSLLCFAFLVTRISR